MVCWRMLGSRLCRARPASVACASFHMHMLSSDGFQAHAVTWPDPELGDTRDQWPPAAQASSSTQLALRFHFTRFISKSKDVTIPSVQWKDVLTRVGVYTVPAPSEGSVALSSGETRTWQSKHAGSFPPGGVRAVSHVGQHGW